MPTFEVKVPVGANQIWMRQQIREAVAEATRRGKLRPELGRLDHRRELRRQPRARARRSSTSISGSATTIEVKLILKGGGCENTNAQYALPVELPHLGRADRTLDGVQQVHPARGVEGAGQGLRARARSASASAAIARPATLHAKEQLFRTLDDVNPDPRLAELEASIMATVNKLEIGTMGFGGKRHADRLQDRRAQPAAGELLRVGRLRLLGVPPPRRRARTRRPARSSSWLYRDPSHPIIPMLDQAGFTRTGREVALHAPLTEEQVRALKVGDVVLVSGRMFTGRDAVHSHLMKHEPPVDLRGVGALSLRSGRREGGRAAGA